MARFVRSLPLCLLFVATTLAFPQSSAQTQPVKATVQRAKKPASSATKPAPPETPQTQPTDAKTAPANASTQPTNAQNPTATGQAQPPSASGQNQPANSPSQATTQKPNIGNVTVFQTAANPQGETTFFMEIDGSSFPTSNPSVFIAPPAGVTVQPVVSASSTRIIVKFGAPKNYFPASVGVGNASGNVGTKDVETNSNANSNLPRIDDVEVLQLNRIVGTGGIKIDGANFGSDKNKVSVTIVPRNPALQVFPLVSPPDQYTCPSGKSGQAAAIPPTSVQTDIVLADFSFPCTPGYSAPFAIARVLATVTDKDGKTSTTSYEMQPPRDINLTYRSTILSQKQASSRFGGGVAKNFYAVQLSLVNKGSVKIQVPLAS